MKRCSRCGETKDDTEFYGLHSHCRTCFKIAGAAYYVTHKAEVRSRRHRRSCVVSVRFVHAIAAARRRGIGWELTLDEYLALIHDNQCHYCGNPLPEIGIGLDRKVNHGKSYSLDNVVPCCYRCNMVRGDIFTYEEFVQYIAPAIRACDAAAKVCQTAAARPIDGSAPPAGMDGYVVPAGIDGYVITSGGIVRPTLENWVDG